MPVLQIRDKDGNFVPINAINGKSAYEQAKDGGYKGSEQEFIALLNGLTNSEDATHYSDFDNPHRVTKEQVGLGNVDNTSDVDKPVSTAQSTAIGEAKKAGTDAQSNLNKHIEDAKKHNTAESGVSMGGVLNINEDNNNSLFGVAVGSDAEATSISVAIGKGALAKGTQSISIGGVTQSSGDNTIAIGTAAQASNYSAIALGEGTTAVDNAVAIGANAGAIFNAIQLGSGVNNNDGTLQVFGYQLLGANGVVPSERLPIATGTYEGTNKYGASNPLTLTFPFVPKVVFICPNKKTSDVPFAWIYGCPVGLTAYNNGVAYASNLTWNGNTLTWYTTDGYPSYQHNNSSTTYYWVAIG